jgi:hypothetical protein
MVVADPWPELLWSQGASTCEALYRWTQIAGKIRLALTPRVNHWWNVTLHVTPRGLTTGFIPFANGAFEIGFDLIQHRLYMNGSDGAAEHLPLKPGSVADFHRDFIRGLHRLGIDVHIWTMPSEIENAVPFEQDSEMRDYDRAWAERLLQVLQQSHRLMSEFRSHFIGKASPVHFFWGGFDLAVTRFSGRLAPSLISNTPNVAAWVMQEAYSHEVSSCGFWPGNGGYGRAAFYCYAYPEPDGFSSAALKTAGAFYDAGLGQFVLPYDDLRRAADPDAALLSFLQETYEAAANLAHWDRAAIERSRPG